MTAKQKADAFDELEKARAKVAYVCDCVIGAEVNEARDDINEAFISLTSAMRNIMQQEADDGAEA